MASGRYQSNLLRFLVGQYWQGMARHRRAVRETRSTIALGGELGVAVVLSPVAMALRASRKRFQKLKQSVTKVRLSLGRAQDADKLLTFSGFGRLSAVSEHLSMRWKSPFGRGALIPSNESSVAEDAKEEKASQSVIVRWWRSVRHALTAPLRKWSGPEISGPLGNRALDSTGELSVELALNKTAGLIVFERRRDLSVPTVSFWVEVLRVVAWLRSRVGLFRRLPGRRVRLTGGASLLKGRGSGQIGESDDLGDVILYEKGRFLEEGLVSAITRCFSSAGIERKAHDKKELEGNKYANCQDYIEASVLTTTYLEHPLEKVLNWVDRAFLWLEACWQRLIDMLSGLKG